MLLTVLFVAAPVKTAESEQTPESGREIEVQIHNPVFRTEEGSCNPEIEFAEKSVFPLREAAPEAREQIETLRAVFAEYEADAEAVHRNGIFLTTSPFQPVHESGTHFPVRKTDTGFHGQIGRFREVSHQKSGEPPVTSGITDTFVFAVAELKGTVEHLLFFGTVEERFPVLFSGDKSICVIDTDFRTCIDAVLTFPEFDQPGFPPIIKVDRERVKDHLETGRHIVVKPGVTGLFLRGVHCGGKKPQSQ